MRLKTGDKVTVTFCKKTLEVDFCIKNEKITVRLAKQINLKDLVLVCRLVDLNDELVL